MTNQSPLFIAAMHAYDEGRSEQALQAMELCAERGEPTACYLVALWYQNGEGSPVDLERSRYWLSRLEVLAEAGNKDAQWEIGQQFRFGDLLPLDIKQANYWLQTAANNGHADAQHHLAWYLQTGQYGFPIDHQLSDTWFQRAFDQSHPETLYVFALREFENGKITERAIALLKRAADKGFKQAEDILQQYLN